MTHSFKLSRRIARLRAPVFAATIFTLVACNTTDLLAPDSGAPSQGVDLGSPAGGAMVPVDAPALAAAATPRGIPFGTFAQPTSVFGSRYNGALRNIAPYLLLTELAAIKARGGRVALMFAGPEGYYKDGAGHFDLNKWKARVDRFQGVNFSSYVSDGTIIGHYLVDEPNDPANWNGQPVPGSVVEQMAQYSKQLWPSMVTIVRTWPDYLDDWSGKYVYLDAAWAQYVANRFPDPRAFISTNVSKAQAKGLALIVGLNVINGSPTKGNMTASQVKEYGTALLSSTYPCAFISWQYNAAYLSSSGIGSVMDALRGQAENRSNKSCRHA